MAPGSYAGQSSAIPSTYGPPTPSLSWLHTSNPSQSHSLNSVFNTESTASSVLKRSLAFITYCVTKQLTSFLNSTIRQRAIGIWSRSTPKRDHWIVLNSHQKLILRLIKLVLGRHLPRIFEAPTSRVCQDPGWFVRPTGRSAQEQKARINQQKSNQNSRHHIPVD